MARWVEDAGGFVHEALRLSLATPHGSRLCLLSVSWLPACAPPRGRLAATDARPRLELRADARRLCRPAVPPCCTRPLRRGVVAAEAIPESQVQQPLIAVPERLLLTTEAAAQRLAPALEEARQQQRRRRPWWALGEPQQPPQPAADPALLLALLLAAERRAGSSSPWWPYIAALPRDIPCGWALSPIQLEAALEDLGGLSAGWRPQVQAAATAVQQRCEAAAAAYGAPLGVAAEDVRWALGHVVSRCFGSGARPLLLARPLGRALALLLGAGTASCAAARICSVPRSFGLLGTRVQAATWRSSHSSTSATTASTPTRRRGACLRWNPAALAQRPGAACALKIAFAAAAGTPRLAASRAPRSAAGTRGRRRRCQQAMSCASAMWQVRMPARRCWSHCSTSMIC